MPQPVTQLGDIVPGDLFEDCRYHPCLCYDVGDADGGDQGLFGISLVDGSTWQCGLKGCGVRKLTPAEAWRWKSEGPADVELAPEHRWWQQDGPGPMPLPTTTSASSPPPSPRG